MTGEPEPFGRYLIPLSERILYALFALLTVVYVRFGVYEAHASDYLPGWYRWVLFSGSTYLTLAIAPQWLLAATTISPGDIRRGFALKRRTEWSEIADFTVGRVWGWSRVVMRLQNGKKLRLLGVPTGALPALRRHLGTDTSAPKGTWWLVDIQS
jgi:hypothetical protein